MNETDVKKGMLGLTVGLILFYAIFRLWGKRDEAVIKQPPITAENINLAISSYQNALSDGASDAKLAELNQELAKEFGLRVKLRNADQKIIVSDLSGKEVKTV